MKPSCLIIAGEKSGEEHCLSFFSKLIEELPEVEFFGVGGDEMHSLGFKNIYHLKEFSSWGVSEVIGKIPFYFKAADRLLEECQLRNTKFAILIDFQTFNLKLSKKLNKLGIKVFYYVAPQAWAWKAWRTKALAESVQFLFTIIPFEKHWFKERGVKQVLSVPHPLYYTYKDQLKNFKRRSFLGKEKKILLLPGSRNFEVKYLLPEFMAALVILREKYQINVGLVLSSSVNDALLSPYRHLIDNEFTNSQLSEALSWADFSLAASGTVTLAAALFSLPCIVTYKSSLLNQFIFETFVTYKGPISLCNIIHQEYIYPELIQDEVNAYRLSQLVEKYFNDEEYYGKTVEKLSSTLSKLQGEIDDVGNFLARTMKGLT